MVIIEVYIQDSLILLTFDNTIFFIKEEKGVTQVEMVTRKYSEIIVYMLLEFLFYLQCFWYGLIIVPGFIHPYTLKLGMKGVG